MNQLTEMRQAYISWKGGWRGARAMAKFAVFIAVFGLSFGVAAGQAGLSPSLSVLMSAIVFAGAAQMAVLEFWDSTIPLLPLVIVTFAVNARHLPMGASLHTWLRHLPWPKRMIAVALLNDMNWPISIEAYRRGERDVGLLIGGGVMIWAAWLFGTTIGVVFGNNIADPAAIGLDVLMITFIAAMLAGLWQGKASLFPWAVAASASLFAYAWLPENWHVIVGALAGGLAGGLGGAFGTDA